MRNSKRKVKREINTNRIQIQYNDAFNDEFNAIQYKKTIQ